MATFDSNGTRRSSNPKSNSNAAVIHYSKFAQVGVLVFGALWLTFAHFVLGTAGPYVSAVVIVVGSCISFSLWLVRWILEQSEGTEQMRAISDPIREGASGFLRTQYGTIAKLAGLVFCLIFMLFLFRDVSAKTGHLSSLNMATLIAFSFLFGCLSSGLAGYMGMWISVRCNIRVAAAATLYKYDDAVAISLRGGLFCGMLVVAMCVLGLSLMFTFCLAYFTNLPPTEIPTLLVGYGFGGSLVALFAQLGGGIYTKAADVGADMVGKVESGIPEDDQRNPAVIADLVGDNVGDCAGRGADLFESISGEIIGAMILGADVASSGELENPIPWMLFPLLIHSFDLVISSAAVMLTKPQLNGKPARPGKLDEEGQDVSAHHEYNHMDSYEDPMDTLKRGYVLSLLFAAVVIGVLTRWLLHTDKVPYAWAYFYGCGLIGVCVSYFFLDITRYYTDYKYSPVQRIAQASTTGHGTNVIAGFSVGLESAAAPVIVICIALLGSYWLGGNCGIHDTQGHPVGGLFGTAVATMGMLSTAVYVLAMDTFGPITDNAGGIVEMSGQKEDVREITDRLDAVGNVTKATTKGYSIGAAGLASFLLFRAFIDVVNEYSSTKFDVVNLAVPEVFVSGLMGCMLVFLFSGWSMASVSRTASLVVDEVRRQFHEHPGILTWKDKPDYERCVAIVTRESLREMIKPGLLAVLVPVAVGFSMRTIGHYTGRPLLGVEGVAATTMFATATGILLALTLNNAGGAWDNAKKYIEGGAHGGKTANNLAYAAAVTGDTVGDPFKDTTGPSIHVLIKLLSTIVLLLCPWFLP